MSSENPFTQQRTPPCCHYWVIEPAEGPFSNGACKICGQQKQFKNYVEVPTWGDERLARARNPRRLSRQAFLEDTC